MPATISTTSTVDTILPEYARFIGAWVGSFSTTTNIGAGTSVISTGLTDRGFTTDDTLNDFYVRCTSGNNDNTIRRISDFTGSSGTITITGTNLSAESGSTTFELYRYDPNLLIETLNAGSQNSFPALYVEVNDRNVTLAQSQQLYARPTSIPAGYVRQLSIEPRMDAKSYGNNIVGSLNCDFENSTIGTDWTATYITLAAEEETTGPDNFMVYAGTQSGKCTVTASQTATLLMTVPSGTNYVGEEINVGIWVYSRTASRVSAAIQLDSGSVSLGSTHSGLGWERLTHTLVADGVSSSIKVGVSATSGTAFVFYADEIVATSGQSEIPRVPINKLFAWREEGDSIRLLEGFAGDRNLLITGMGMIDFSQVDTTGSNTIELNQSQRRMLYNYAAMQLYQGEIDTLDTSEQQQALNRFNHYRNRVNEGAGMMPPMAMVRNVAV
tara:strand:- start:922 stop:2244 length:1323 start_codon:yes stop_codon:yes gene_type:complete